MGKPVIPVFYQFTEAEIAAGAANNLPKGSSVIVIDANAQPIDIKAATGGGQAPTEVVTGNNINTVLSAAGGAGWEKVQATTPNYVITRPASGAGLDLHIEAGSLAAITAVSWPVPASGVDQLRIRNFSGQAQTFTAGAGWQIVTADGNPVTGGSYSIPDDRAVEITLDPDGFAQVVPWGGEVSVATFNTHTGNVSNPHVVTKTQVGLSNVDNVSDISKPVSTAQQTAFDTKEPKVAGKGLSTVDFTTAKDTKLSGIATGATANVVNNTLISASITEALSAAQGKALQDGKQAIHEGTVALRTPNNLTSNTSDPNYILTASSEHTIHLFYRAFDNNDANFWYTLGTLVATGDIELRYKIRPTNLLLKGTVTAEYWTRWQLLGSNDGTTWDILVDRSGTDEALQDAAKNFPITTHKEYKRFRFNGLNAVGTNIPLSRLEISGVESATNFVDWTAYTPVVTSESGGWTNYTATGRYRIVNKMLTVSFRVIFTGTPAAADGLYVSLPPGLTMNNGVMTGNAGWDTDLVGFGLLGDSGTVSGVPAIINTRTNQKVLVKYYNAAAGSYLTCPGLSNAAPWAWAWNDTVDGQFTVPIL